MAIKLDLTDAETKATVESWTEGETYPLVFVAPDKMEEETASEDAAAGEEAEAAPSGSPMDNLMAAKQAKMKM